jgi:hypothetical protein
VKDLLGAGEIFRYAKDDVLLFAFLLSRFPAYRSLFASSRSVKSSLSSSSLNLDSKASI